jgi:hypothetical protein
MPARTVALLVCLTLLPLAAVAQGPIGELSLGAGYAQAAGGPVDGGSYGAVASFAFVRGPVSLGPEAGFYRFGGSGRVTTLGGVVRCALLQTGPLLYAVAGLDQGAYRGPVEINLFSGSAGLGIGWRPRRSPGELIAEGRWHRSLQASGGAGQPAFFALLVGTRLRW